MTPTPFHQPHTHTELVLGAVTPWGSLLEAHDFVGPLVAVTARYGQGVFLPDHARDRLDGIVSPHGQAWWGWSVGAAAAALACCADEPLANIWINTLYAERPDWLDTLAPRCGLPNAAQVQRIRVLHERFNLDGLPTLRAFAREDDTGMVHGWIGDRLFVGIEPDGRAHS